MGQFCSLGWQTLQWMWPNSHWKIGTDLGISKQTGHSKSLRKSFEIGDVDMMFDQGRIWNWSSNSSRWPTRACVVPYVRCYVFTTWGQIDTLILILPCLFWVVFNLEEFCLLTDKLFTFNFSVYSTKTRVSVEPYPWHDGRIMSHVQTTYSSPCYIRDHKPGVPVSFVVFVNYILSVW